MVQAHSADGRPGIRPREQEGDGSETTLRMLAGPPRPQRRLEQRHVPSPPVQGDGQGHEFLELFLGEDLLDPDAHTISLVASSTRCGP